MHCRAHTARLPPDLLWLEWFQGRAQETWDTVRGHPLYVYHKNLLDHIGTHSSFAIRPDRLPFPQCFDSMAKVWSIHPLERFNVSHSFPYFRVILCRSMMCKQRQVLHPLGLAEHCHAEYHQCPLPRGARPLQQ